MIGPWLRFLQQISGGKPRSVAVGILSGVLDVTGPSVSSSRGLHATGSGLLRFTPGPNELQPAADQSLGNSVGAIGWPVNRPAHLSLRVRPAPGVERSGSVRALLLVLTNFCRSLRGGGWPGPG